ncbi:MAG: hypothetical protein LBM16_05645 [Clostridiales bacterium]|jgi:hypothetical protein|nr:hypothetical protein [Clostridiales bacterium]
MLNPKTDPQIELAQRMIIAGDVPDDNLVAGYDRQQERWRLIVKYSGDISTAAAKWNADTDILTESYAIINIAYEDIARFSNEREVDYIEKPRKIKQNIARTLTETCINQVQHYPQYMLKGSGVIVAIIDSGIEYKTQLFS